MSKVSPARRIAWPLAKLLAFAAVTLVVTGLLAQSLGAPPVGSLWGGGAPSYHARFTDVTGVLPGDDVRIAGVKVGRVTRVRLVDTATPAAAGGAVAELTFTVDRDVPLPTSVRATIRYRNLVGQRYLALAEGPGGAATLGGTLRPGGTIPLPQTAPALDLTTLFNGFQPLFSALNPHDVNTLAYEIIQVLQGEAGTVAGLLHHSASLISTLADRDAVIAKVIGNLNAVLSTLDGRRAALAQTIDALQQFVSGLSADRTAIGQAVTSISDLTSATAGLLKDARPDLSADIGGLGSLAGILNDNSATIDATLAQLPGEYQSLTRTASYGSWFNFFLCDFDGRVTLPGAGSVNPASFGSPAAACKGGGR
jgi:phospholipid/cholesterol/gamma-HCH transport system substrate-binding protein